jgi:VWFA-related protein
MLLRRVMFIIAMAVLAVWAGWRLGLAAPVAYAQQDNGQGATPLIRAETRLVLVDTIVTDKKGNYLDNLKQQDFKVFEDGKEQQIKSFSFEQNAAPGGEEQKRYLVLFFDNSTMDPADQVRAREAAAKFIDANAGPNRLIALVDFGGSIRIAQNFTADADRLKKAVAGLRMSSVNPNAPATGAVEVASLGTPPLVSAEADFGAYTMLLALRSMAKNLRSVPGRKSLILLTSGFPITPDRQSELTAVIDACNKSNVAVYPIDVRGLINITLPGPQTGANGYGPVPQVARVVPAGLRSAGGTHARPGAPRLVFVAQHGAGGGGGGGGGHAGGGGSGTGGGGTAGGAGGGHGTGGGTGTGGSKGGTGGTGSGTGGGRTTGASPTNSSTYYNNPNQPRQIVPDFPPSVADNQQILYQLADGTGGFVIVNSNDLLGGLEKIAKEQTHYYVLGYTPEVTPEGSCHTLKVKVERSGTVVRSRSGYCNVRPADILAGKPEEKDLESRANGSQAGNVSASMTLPFFYTTPNTARVNLAMEIPPGSFKFEKQNGKQHATLNVLGLAYKADETVAARFSDTIDIVQAGKKEAEEFNREPFHYETQFDIAVGAYKLKVALTSGGDHFAKLEVPLVIDAYDGKFGLSGLALSKETRRASDMATGLDAELLADRTPLVARGIQVVPAGNCRFKKSDAVAFYAEIYEPLLANVQGKPPQVGMQYVVVDRKTGETKFDTGLVSVAEAFQPGSPVIPLALRLPLDNLNPGAYRVEFKAIDDAGHTAKPRSADFEVE